ncbi:MAG TPA: MerR family transcriptional regulator [Mycobacteriales bacterium]|nr:MerR family transcriptional regulator [Mycobacteriales bacterium]
MTEVTDLSGFRIDELARRSGESVDTIRYYQRVGLLEPPRRVGRTAHYGPAHVARLELIRSLQAQHLSLAAIKALIDHRSASLAETLFPATGGDFTRAQLAEAAGLPLDLIHELEEVRFLKRPEELGRDAYDQSDLRVLATVRALLEQGLPRKFVVRLGAIYAEGLAAVQERMFSLFTVPGPDTADELLAVQELLARNVAEVLPNVEAMLHALHQHTVQGLTVESIARAEELLETQEQQTDAV